MPSILQVLMWLSLITTSCILVALFGGWLCASFKEPIRPIRQFRPIRPLTSALSLPSDIHPEDITVHCAWCGEHMFGHTRSGDPRAHISQGICKPCLELLEHAEQHPPIAAKLYPVQIQG